MEQKVETDLRLSAALVAALQCPCCSSALQRNGNELVCGNTDCAERYPIVDGVPVLINEDNSTLALETYRQGRGDTIYFGRGSLKHRIANRLPEIGRNWKAAKNYGKFVDLLTTRPIRPTILIIGAGVIGKGFDAVADHTAVDFVYSDIAITPLVQVVVDAHDIPFEDNTFDGVIAQAVLEHVADPARCVAEIHRVLRPDGMVYAEIPFMQQVHGGGVDFTRFTHLGIRRLFRNFAEVDSGACCGPGMALAWSIQYFWLSFTVNPLIRSIIRGIATVTLFPLKYIDPWLIDRPGGLDAASALYFTGQKAEAPKSDKEILAGYRGAL